MARPKGSEHEQVVQVRMSGELLDAINAYRRVQPELPTRSEAIRYILKDWLIGHGVIPLPAEKPEGDDSTSG